MVVVPVIAAPPADTVRPPVVATRPVEAVNEPVTFVFPVAFPIATTPVPPVPMVVVAAPEALIDAVPVCIKAARVVAPVTPRVPPIPRLPDMLSPARVVSPVTPRVPPIVALVVTVRVEPAVRVVVEAIEPGAVKTAGIERVIVETALVTVI